MPSGFPDSTIVLHGVGHFYGAPDTEHQQKELCE